MAEGKNSWFSLLGNGFRAAWGIITATVSNVRGTEFLYVMAALAAVTSIAVSLHGGKWQYALIGGMLAITFSVPAVFLAKIDKFSSSSAFRAAGHVTIWGFLLIAFALAFLLISTSVAQWPRPIEDILHINPVRAAEPDEWMVDVPVRVSLVDTSAHDALGNADGVLELPPRTRARFLRAKVDRWSNDPYESVATFLSRVPVIQDISGYYNEFTSSGSNPESFKTNFLRSVFDKLVVLGLASDRPSGQRQETEHAINKYLDLELLPMLTNSSYRSPLGDESRRLSESNFWVAIDCRERGNAFTMAAAKGRQLIWKRLLAAEFVLADDIHKLLGPYFDVTAEGGTPPPAAGRPFPTERERRGCLVAGLYRLKGGIFEQVKKPVAFYHSSHVVVNDTTEPLSLRLGINDDIPEDNGSGRATVAVAFENLK